MYNFPIFQKLFHALVRSVLLHFLYNFQVFQGNTNMLVLITLTAIAVSWPGTLQMLWCILDLNLFKSSMNTKVFFNWDSLHAKLNSHYGACSINLNNKVCSINLWYLIVSVLLLYPMSAWYFFLKKCLRHISGAISIKHSILLFFKFSFLLFPDLKGFFGLS